MRWKIGPSEFAFPRPVVVMGIVNVTPDSFSDGGEFLAPERAVAHALQLVGEGAEIIDIGGESTRPGATPVAATEESARVLPVLEAVRARTAVPLSIDTMKPEVAAAALQAGATIVNDVGAGRTDDRMWRVVAESGAGYVCMHMRGTPQTMQSQPEYEDVVGEVEKWFADQLLAMNRCGVALEQIILDPGIGFGKTLEHNLLLLGGLERFGRLGRPVLVGASRKSFIAKVVNAAPAARLPGSLACACLAAARGVQVLRVHDVAETVQAVRVTEAILAKQNH